MTLTLTAELLWLKQSLCLCFSGILQVHRAYKYTCDKPKSAAWQAVMVTTGPSCFCRCWLSEEHSVMGILPGMFRVMAVPHHWPYGHNQTEANVPAVSCIMCFAMTGIPDGCDLAAQIWQLLTHKY